MNEVRIGRIDVNHVKVTREDGTTVTLAGTYVVRKRGATIAGPFATRTGKLERILSRARAKT